MSRIIQLVMYLFVLLQLTSVLVFAGQLDEYYLQNYGDLTSSMSQKTALLQPQETIDTSSTAIWPKNMAQA